MSATTPPQMSVCSPPLPQPSLSRFSHPLRPTTNTVGARYRTIMATSRGATSPLGRISPNIAKHSHRISNPNTRDSTKANIKPKTSPHRNPPTNSVKLVTTRMIQPQTSLVNSRTRILEHLHANQALLVDSPRQAHGFTQTARYLRASKIVTSRATSLISKTKGVSSILQAEMPPAHPCLLHKRSKCQKRTRTSTVRMFKSVGRPFTPQSKLSSKRI